MIIDVLFLITAGYGFYMGFSRGIIKTVFTILSVMIGIIAAAKFGPSMTDFLESMTDSRSPLMFVAGFLLTFVVTMVLIRLIANFMEKALESANINIINQAAGGIVMASIFTALYSTLVLFGDRSHIVENDTKDQSFTYPYLVEFPGKISVAVKKVWPVFTDFWDHSVDFMDRLEKFDVEKTESEQVYDVDDNDNNTDQAHRY